MKKIISDKQLLQTKEVMSRFRGSKMRPGHTSRFIPVFVFLLGYFLLLAYMTTTNANNIDSRKSILPLQQANPCPDSLSSAPDEYMRKIFSEWEQHSFKVLLKKYGVKKFNCKGGCGGVRIKAQFYVSQNGKIENMVIKSESLCYAVKLKRENFIADFIASFNTITFPADYFDKCYTTVFGNVLPC